MKNKFALISIILCLSVIMGSCSNNNNPSSASSGVSSSSQSSYSISVEVVGGGQAYIQKSTVSSGEQNLLTAISNSGYTLTSITIYGQTLQDLNYIGEYNYPFITQPQDTTIIVTFTINPNSSQTSISSSSHSSSSQNSSFVSSSQTSISSSNNSSSSVSSSTSDLGSSSTSLSSTSSQSSYNQSASSNSSSSSSSSVVEPNIPIENQKPTLSTIDTGVSGLGDPFILADSKTNVYYMYATSNQQTGFKVWTSTNLTDWTDKGECYTEVDSGQNLSPFKSEYWAPEVVYNGQTQKYILYFSATERTSNCKKIGIALSDSPLGPFVHPVGINGVMFDKGSSNVAYIDAHFFLDDDSKAYLLYCNDCSKNSVNGVNTSQTWIRELDSSWTTVTGSGKMISTPTQTWETQEDSGSPNTQWNEAPGLYKHDGKYYLTYSANPYWNTFYGVGCAVSENIWGDYIKYDWNPILTRVEGQNGGLGHNMFFKDFSGNLWTSYHRHTDKNNPSDNRTAMLSPAWFDNGILKIEYGQTYEEETTHKDESIKEEKETVDITTKSPKETITTNITNIGDPFILADQNSKKYYMYATSDSAEGYRVWESCDLVNWTDMGQCFNKNTSNTFGHREFWAPEVVYNPNSKTYILYYTARNAPLRDLGITNDGTAGNYNEAYNSGVLKTGVATSFSPLGPFVDCTGAPMFDLGPFVATIDASLFIDDDGQGYLYYSRDCSQNVVNGQHTSQTWVTKVDSSWTKTVGEHYLVTTPEDEWEIKSGVNNGYLWNEGPYVLKHNGKYYLTFSANLYASNDYAVGVAVSSNPLSGFVKSEDNPILTRIPNKMAGPGHCMFFTDFDGYLWCCYHVQTNMNNPGGNRKMVISGAWFNNGKLTIEYKE